ncbi:hypothetical protein GF325_16130 [Candidatus Bathyarchaeota archaeon]|nr:hypothetical protein [Candidatus Bathyarchaeota archaeon]
MIVESKVGSKGELFLTKEIREKLGLKPGDKIYFEVKNEKLQVWRIPDLLEILELPSIGKPETPEEIEKDLEQFFKAQEMESVKEK